MLQQYLQSLDGMVTYQVVSFTLFLAVAAGVTFWVLRMNREHADRMSRMPLDDQTLNYDSKTEVRS